MAHDCVIVPGLGAVLAHTLPARMDATGEKMLAPVRVFTFNPALNQNVGGLFLPFSPASSLPPQCGCPMSTLPSSAVPNPWPSPLLMPKKRRLQQSAAPIAAVPATRRAS